jgi:hypothetical protein
MNAKRTSRLVVAGLSVVALAAPLAGQAGAAGGQCQYGQKSDGSCWDAEAKAAMSNVPATGNAPNHQQVLNPDGTVTNR